MGVLIIGNPPTNNIHTINSTINIFIILHTFMIFIGNCDSDAEWSKWAIQEHGKQNLSQCWWDPCGTDTWTFWAGKWDLWIHFIPPHNIIMVINN